MKTIYIKIYGIHCEYCISIISECLLSIKNIKNVEIKKNIATISYTGKLNSKKIIDNIIKLGYDTNEKYISKNINDLKVKQDIISYLIIILSIILILVIINKLFGFNIFNFIPSIDEKTTYSMLFITGMLTSIHCISMCGAINLVSSINNKRSIKRPLLYNVGRVISYTIIGGIVGLIGSVLAINNYLSGFIIILASIFMLYMSLSMIGIVSIKNIKFKFKSRNNNPLIIGLLNGLMPCGPLQAMQIYALSTGSFIKGALSMLLFSLGTVPLMLFVGVVANIINNKSKIILNKIAPCLILILSLTMLNRGLLTLNIDLFKINNSSKYQQSVIDNNYQIVEFDLDYDNYEDIILKKDIPTKIIIHVDKKHLTGCNNEIIISDFDIKKKLEIGDNIIEFTPNKKGIFTYTCWMNMIKNNIKVIE